MRVDQVVLLYEHAMMAALWEVESPLIAEQKTGEPRVSQEQRVSTLLTALHFVGQRYQGGRAGYLDVLTSQRSLFDAELRLARTRRLN